MINKPTQKPLVRLQRLSSLLRSSNKAPNALFSPSCEDKTRGQNEDTRSETSETGEKTAHFTAKISRKPDLFAALRYQR